MKVYIPCIGSRGDHQPFIALGVELKARGHEVYLGIHEKYQSMCEGRGFETRILRGNLEDALTQTPEGRKLQDANLFNAIGRARAVMDPLCRLQFEDMHNHVSEIKPDIIAATTVAGLIGTRIMEASGAKGCYLNTVPNYPTKYFSPPTMGSYQSMVQFLNKMKWNLGIKMFHSMMYKKLLDELHAKFGYEPYPKSFSRGYYDAMELNQYPLLHVYSPTLLGKPADWPEKARVCGFMELKDSQADAFQAPEDIQKFLDAGEAPIYIGFGSMLGAFFDDAWRRRFLDTIVKAVEEVAAMEGKGGVRAIVYTVGAGDVPPSSDRCFLLDRPVPHDWLLPKCRACIIHGGAGTVSACMKAGKPTGVIPFGLQSDQPFWADILHFRHVGPKWFGAKHFSLKKFRSMIADLVTKEKYVKNAAAWRDVYLKEDGVKVVADAIEAL